MSLSTEGVVDLLWFWALRYTLSQGLQKSPFVRLEDGDQLFRRKKMVRTNPINFKSCKRLTKGIVHFSPINSGGVRMSWNGSDLNSQTSITRYKKRYVKPVQRRRCYSLEDWWVGVAPSPGPARVHTGVFSSVPYIGISLISQKWMNAIYWIFRLFPLDLSGHVLFIICSCRNAMFCDDFLKISRRVVSRAK